MKYLPYILIFIGKPLFDLLAKIGFFSFITEDDTFAPIRPNDVFLAIYACSGATIIYILVILISLFFFNPLPVFGIAVATLYPALMLLKTGIKSALYALLRAELEAEKKSR